MGAFDGLKKTMERSAGKALQATQHLPAAVKNVDITQVSESLKGIAQKGSAALDARKEKSREAKKAVQEALANADESRCVSKEAALQAIYLLMAVDGKIQAEELEKFDSIGRDTDPAFEEHKATLLRECEPFLQAAADAEERYDNIHDGIGDILRPTGPKMGPAEIPGKLLVWNLWAVAYSDGDCTEDERRLIRYVSKQLHIDRAIPLEMESTVQTLLAIEREEAWLRGSARPYTEVEVQLKLLAERRSAILQGVHALIVD